MLRYSEEEARRSVADLRSQALESRDLAGALTDMVRQMTQGTGAHADVNVEGVVQRLDASQEHHLLRIGLEALTNALKHSGASQIRSPCGSAVTRPTCRSKTTAAASVTGPRTCPAAVSVFRAFGNESTS